MPPTDKTGVYMAWVTRGFDPWTREGGAGNVYVFVDQYSGKVVYDGIPEEGNVFDQAWDDWSFPLHTGDCGGPVTRRGLGRDRALAHRARGHRRDDVRGAAQQAGEALPARREPSEPVASVRRAQRAAAGDGDPSGRRRTIEEVGARHRSARCRWRSTPADCGACSRTSCSPGSRRCSARSSCWRCRCCSRCTHSASRRRCARSDAARGEGRVTGAVFAAILLSLNLLSLFVVLG